MTFLLRGFNPNFPKTLLLLSLTRPNVSLSGLVSPWDTLTLQDLASPNLFWLLSYSTIITCPSGFWRNLTRHADKLFPLRNEHGFEIFYRSL
jgi:hypothetical protein